MGVLGGWGGWSALEASTMSKLGVAPPVLAMERLWEHGRAPEAPRGQLLPAPRARAQVARAASFARAGPVPSLCAQMLKHHRRRRHLAPLPREK